MDYIKEAKKTWVFKCGNHGYTKTCVQTGIPKVL